MYYLNKLHDKLKIHVNGFINHLVVSWRKKISNRFEVNIFLSNKMILFMFYMKSYIFYIFVLFHWDCIFPFYKKNHSIHLPFVWFYWDCIVLLEALESKISYSPLVLIIKLFLKNYVPKHNEIHIHVKLGHSNKMPNHVLPINYIFYFYFISHISVLDLQTSNHLIL